MKGRGYWAVGFGLFGVDGPAVIDFSGKDDFVKLVFKRMHLERPFDGVDDFILSA